jgi:hypothetical protein
MAMPCPSPSRKVLKKKKRTKAPRKAVVVLYVLCVPNVRVIWPYGHYTLPYKQNVVLQTGSISRVILCESCIWFRRRRGLVYPARVHHSRRRRPGAWLSNIFPFAEFSGHQATDCRKVAHSGTQVGEGCVRHVLALPT